jgi:hypothetical protein
MNSTQRLCIGSVVNRHLKHLLTVLLCSRVFLDHLWPTLTDLFHIMAHTIQQLTSCLMPPLSYSDALKGLRTQTPVRAVSTLNADGAGERGNKEEGEIAPFLS